MPRSRRRAGTNRIQQDHDVGFLPVRRQHGAGAIQGQYFDPAWRDGVQGRGMPQGFGRLPAETVVAKGGADAENSNFHVDVAFSVQSLEFRV